MKWKMKMKMSLKIQKVEMKVALILTSSLDNNNWTISTLPLIQAICNAVPFQTLNLKYHSKS